MTDDDELRRVIDAVAPTILINNAGGGGHIAPYFPDGDWSAKLALNLRAPMLATQLALPHMGDGGAIVNIASSAGHNQAPHPSAEYAAAKAGLIRFTTSAQLGPIRMNCIVPDWILTERAREELQAMGDEERANAPTPIPVEDIAAEVLALIEGDHSRQVVVLPR